MTNFSIAQRAVQQRNTWEARWTERKLFAVMEAELASLTSWQVLFKCWWH